MPKRSRDQQKSATTNDEFPCRECSSLFASQVTITCAMMVGCVPCAYKIGCFDVALDTSFCKQVPNQRPEQCCRSKCASADSSAAPGTLGYKRGMKVLTVGDGDFTFSLAIARIILPNGGSLYATSYERRETISAVYPAIDETIQELARLGAFVHFEVDATRLADTLPALKGQAFDRIVWNFPCTAVAKGQDGQNQEMENNKRLVRAFVGNARFFLAEKGEIHINHKTKPPFNQWTIEDVALEDCQESPKVGYCGRIVLDRFLLPPYTPRKALDRKSFPVHDACTYVFALASRVSTDTFENVVVVECLKDQMMRRSGDLSSAGTVVPVTRDLILKLRSRMLTLAEAHKHKPKKKSRKR